MSRVPGVLTGLGVAWLTRSLVAAVVLGVIANWLWHLVFHQYAPCWACGGTGKNFGSTKSRYGRCFWCKGRRERLVLGARAVHRMLGRREP